MEDVRCRVRMELEFTTAGQARQVAAALEPDNECFVRTKLEGRKLHAGSDASSIPALLHTLDDYLACLAVAARLASESPEEE